MGKDNSKGTKQRRINYVTKNNKCMIKQFIEMIHFNGIQISQSESINQLNISNCSIYPVKRPYTIWMQLYTIISSIRIGRSSSADPSILSPKLYGANAFC